MRKLALAVLAALALTLVSAATSGADRRQLPCGLPDLDGTAWIDFAWPSLSPIFAHRGVILATGSGEFPAQMRATGAGTVHWDMNLKARVGKPDTPNDPATIVDRANKLFDYAVQQTGCPTPLIAENELFGAGLVTPWSDTNAQYRDNVLVYLRTLAERGARPFLLVSSRPYTGGEAADWWREVVKYADLVREVYPSAKALYKQGPIMGNRTLRTSLRGSVADFTAIGIQTSKLGVMLGFHRGQGTSGRGGLQPASAWFRVAKWQALAAKAVAKETNLASVWSWGWGEWTEADKDPDRGGAACVWLWARSPSLCNGPAGAGPAFDASLTEGQVILPSDAKCIVGETTLRNADIARLQKLTGDREIAVGALLARAAESRSSAKIPAKAVFAAERAVIASHFGGSSSAYRRALASAGATPEVARSVLADVIRHVQIEKTLAVAPPSGAAVSTFYRSYPELLARSVTVKPAPSWLGWRTRGWALASMAPTRVLNLPTAKKPSVVRSVEGSFKVHATGTAQPLAALPLASVSRSIQSVLQVFARRVVFDSWTTTRQVDALRTTICRRDDLPVPTAVELTDYLPFLSANG